MHDAARESRGPALLRDRTIRLLMSNCCAGHACMHLDCASAFTWAWALCVWSTLHCAIACVNETTALSRLVRQHHKSSGPLQTPAQTATASAKQHSLFQNRASKRFFKKKEYCNEGGHTGAKDASLSSATSEQRHHEGPRALR